MLFQEWLAKNPISPITHGKTAFRDGSCLNRAIANRQQTLPFCALQACSLKPVGVGFSPQTAFLVSQYKATMSGIIVDRAILYLSSQTGFRPGDAFVFVILEIGASGFKVRTKSGRLKSMDPPLIEGKSKEEFHIFQVEDEARRYFKSQVELLTQIGFHPSFTRIA